VATKQADQQSGGEFVVTLVLENESGERDSVVLDGPGGAARISVGEVGHRSGVWRIWANKNKADVYVAERGIARVQKFSLHQSGDWRAQWTSVDHAQTYTASKERILDQWTRPQASSGGWTKGLSIFIPTTDVRHIANDATKVADVLWLPIPDDPVVWGVHVVIAEPDRGFTSVKGAIPIGGFTLVSGEVALIVISQEPLQGALADRVAEMRAKAEPFTKAIAIPEPSIRMAVHGNGEDGGRHIWDLAVFPDA
jgi:hypothetical protein